MSKKVNTVEDLTNSLEPGGMVVTSKGFIGFVDPSATGELPIITTHHSRGLSPAEFLAYESGPVEVFSRAEVEELANKK